MRKLVRFFLIAAVVVFCGPMWTDAQNTIYDLSPQTSEYSIIRHYKDKVDITFNLYLCEENDFNYIDRQTNTEYKASLPCGFNVSDFRIHNKYVYFCGQYESDVIVGWFDIDSVFFHGGSIHLAYMPVTSNNAPDLNATDRLTMLSKMKVYERNGEIHMVMIGEGCHIYNNYLYGHSAIVDAWTSNHSTVRMEYTMDYFDEYRYDDLAVTENYVVLVAHHIGTSFDYLAPNVFYYSLPTTPNIGIFSQVSLSNPINAICYFTEPDFISYNNGAMMITDMGGDKFVTVFDALYRNSDRNIIVTYYNDPLSWPVARYAFKPTTQYSYKEITYNKQMKSLYMMKRDGTCVIERLGPPFNNLDVYKTVDTYVWMSIDTLDNSGNAIVSGTEPLGIATKKILRFEEQVTNECVGLYVWEIREEEEYRGHHYPVQYYYRNGVGSILVQPNITITRINIICD